VSTIRIEAENYTTGGSGVTYFDRTRGNSGGKYRNDDVDITDSLDVDGGFQVAWIEQGEWLTYDFTLLTSGSYQVLARTASAVNRNYSLQVTVGGQATKVDFGGTGGWYSWQSVQSLGEISLSAGNHQLRLDMLTSDFNINYLELVPVLKPPTPTPNPIPQPIRIEAENYRTGASGVTYFDRTRGNSGGKYRKDDVDISDSQDIGGGFLLGWIDQGEWLTYDVNVPTSGVYQLSARVASAVNSNYRFQATVGGQVATVNFGGTGGWRNWQTVQTSQFISLGAGNRQLRLDMLTGGFNVNYVELTPVPYTYLPNLNLGTPLNGSTGNQTFNGTSGIETIIYAQAKNPIFANLQTGVVNHKFATLPNKQFKIMPLGDSNTFGMIEWDSGAYRDDLWNLFLKGGFNIDFVGPRSSGPDGFDKNNAGFGGWTINNIASQVNGWLSTYTPDMVLLMIGTNDILKNENISAAPSRLSNLIDQITNRLPNTQVLVGSISPITTTALKQKQGIDFNSYIPGLVSDKVAKGKKVSFVDIYSSLTSTDLQDNVHPTTDGYNKVANTWYQAIINTNLAKDTLNNIENIIGSPYNDVLIGDSKSNIINGGGGDDLITGGTGKDIFILAKGEGTDTITDFVVGEDLFGLYGGLTFNQLTIEQGIANNQNDTWIFNNGESLVLLNGVQASTITSNSFMIA
jgi:lysophospholipase L1-like esterase